MIKLKLYLLFLGICHVAITQDALMISGRVVDAETKAPLSFATIGLDNTPSGVIANSEGAFDLIINTGSTITISTLGYESRSFNIEKILQSGKNQFELTNLPVLLEEVVVSTKKKELDGNTILKLALKNQKENFPDDNYALSVFFRETNMVGDNYTKFVEAAATIHGKKYPNNAKKVYIDQIKTIDTIAVPEPVRLQFETYNPFREFQGLIGQLSKVRACRLCDYKIEKYTSYKGKPAVIISSVANSQAYPRFMRYTVDLENYAVVRMEFESSQPFGEGLPRDVGTHQSNLNYLWRTFDYEEYEGRYYLSRYHQKAVFEYRSHSNPNESFQSTHQFTVITNKYAVGTESQEHSDELMSYRDQIGEKSRAYSADFWKHYNVLKQTQLDQKVREELKGANSADSLITKEK